MSGKLRLAERFIVVRRSQPHLADRPDERLRAEALDVEIVLHGGTPPGMSIETRLRVLEEARRFLPEGEKSDADPRG